MAASRVVHRQCQLCEAHCGIRVHVGDDQAGHAHVTRIEGDPDDVLSKGYICPKATALADVHRDPERLRTPLVRVGDGFEEATWADALGLAGERIRALRDAHGRDAVGVYQGNPTAHSTSALAMEVLKKALRSRHVFSASSVDQFPQHLVAHEMFGDMTLMPVADVDRTDHLLVIGANPAVSNGSITTMPDARGRLKAIRARGGRVVVVDPRATETARIASEHVAVRPGGDPHLLLGMLSVVFAEGLSTPRVPVSGLRTLRDVAGRWSPERAAGPAGVDAAVIRRMALEFATAPSACAYGRIGVCHHTTGSLTHWLITALNVVTGNLDRPGGAMFASPPVDLAEVLRLLHGPSARGRWRGRASGLPELRGELPVAGLPAEVMTPGRGRLRGLLTVAGNPALSSPQADRVEAALRSLDLLVSVDMYVTETTRHADVILPPVSHLERDDLDVVFPYFSVRNNLRWSPRVFDPPAGAMGDWEIILRLAAEVPGGPAGTAARPLLRRVASAVDDDTVVRALVATGPRGPLRRGRDGITAAQAKAAPGGLDLGPLQPRLPGILATPDRRVDLAPPALVAAVRTLGDPVPGVRRGAGSPARSADGAPRADGAARQHDETAPRADGAARQHDETAPRVVGRAAADGFDLHLIGRRHLRSNNSWLHNVESMVKGRPRCTVAIHPDDAALRGLVHGGLAVVTSPVGRLELPVEVTEDMRPGVVAIPHGWGHDVKGVGWSTAQANPGVNVNVLTDAALRDELSGNAALNATLVRVEPAA